MNDQTQQGQILGDQDPTVTDDMYDDLGAGIASSFPVISYRNSRWRVRWQGNEELLVDQQNRPVEEIGVCLVRVPNHKSKRYWIQGYKQDNRPPDCWSNDSVRPHPTVIPPAQPQNWPTPRPSTCAECYWDQFNTSQRQDGSVGKGKACADYKRCVVKVYYPQMPPGFEGADGMLFLMQVPPDSLQAIKKYGEALSKERLAAAATVTFVGLVIDDQKVSYPKLTFRKGPKLSTDEIEQIRYARGSDDAARILNEEIAFIDPGAITYGPEEQVNDVDQGNAQQVNTQQPNPQPQPVVQPTVAQPTVRQRAPSSPVQQPPIRPATGIPPQPQRAATPAPSPGARVMPPSPPNAPSARAIDPRMVPQPQPRNVQSQPVQSRPGTINTAVNRPAPPPPSTRTVRPTLPPAIVNSNEQPQEQYTQEQQYAEQQYAEQQTEYGTAAEVEDELDRSFGDLQKRGIIEK